MATLFFSYSHKDEALRNELETHLTILKRQGIIDVWNDRRILAGDHVDHTISEHLEAADIVLLLVSPDFLASSYCYDVEMQRALEMHRAGEARVIPIILRPCEWKETDLRELMAAPTDGKPVALWPDLDTAFLDVTSAIRKAATATASRRSHPHRTDMPVPRQIAKPTPAQHIPQIRSSNLRIRKQFTDHDKDVFLEEAFDYIAKFFEGSIEELEARNSDIQASFRRIDTHQFTAAVYRNGSEMGRCRIWLGDRNSVPGGIAYSENQWVDENSYNECLYVACDEQMLFLSSSMAAFNAQGGDSDAKMTPQGGAELLWGMLIGPLQR